MKYDGMVFDTYTALLLGIHKNVNNIVERGKDKSEIDKNQNFEDVMKNATVTYTSMTKQKIWPQTDPKDAKILALTMLNNGLQHCKNGSFSGNSDKSYAGAASGSGGTDMEWKFTLDP